ncbi:hypothetical protein [Flexithrix dorotheae]|uniref:hypothetical protein n=1 Tax=Flexithrix dorotheae TaxID=70993 RepID=UPI0003761D1A|nr:hypothetical protein [Flexithrix dorotheae]
MNCLKKYFFIFTLLLGGFSCKEKEVNPDEVNNDISNLSIKLDQEEYEALSLKMSKGDSVSDEFRLNKVYKEGNFLMIEISYSGGCKEHSFEIIWPEAVILIYPPQYPVVLTHDNNNDSCEAYITETLKFDLTDPDLGFNEESIKVMEIIVQNGSNKEESISTQK